MSTIDNHCGHVYGPCACPNPPDPEQAYHAVRRDAEELQSRVAALEADARDAVWVDEQTLFKVDAALLRTGLTEQQTKAAINEMLNAGILFRERRVSHG